MFPKVKSTGRNFVLIIEANKWYIMNTIENSNAFINFLLCIRHYLCRTEFHQHELILGILSNNAE